MRLLLIADVHLERPFKWLGHARGAERRQELRDALTCAVDRAQNYQVDAICIAGDLFERENAPPPVGEFLRATFERVRPIPVLIAPGNHDYFSVGCLYDRISWPSNVHVFRDAIPRPYPVADGAIWGAAFIGPERHQSPLENFRVDGAGLHLGLFHADVIDGEGSSPYGPLAPEEIERSGLALALLGHVHGGRVDEARRFAYPGSIEPLDLSEDGMHGALLVDVSRSGSSIQHIPLARRTVISAEIDVSSVSTIRELAELLAAQRPQWDGHDVRLRVIGSLQGELLIHPEAIRETLDRGDVDLVLDVWPAEDLDSLARQRTTLGAFVRAVREKVAQATSPEEARRWEDVLAAGVAAFHGHEVILT